ncbi:glycosyltransferase family 2 protein [Methylobacterium nodulans]|uniref:glycosyltransferase family 2 protein n=1 Tax=Methylobacterium nodulans TaxID=114616 RepID=UPI0001618BED|nr:glycosyltransferase [Methylobacterium nodulans]
MERKTQPKRCILDRVYLNNYNDHLKECENPFFHYLTIGKSAGFRPNPYNKGLWPSLTAPDEDAWANAIRANNIEKSEVVVIIPVYKGYNETLSAIHAVLCNPQQVPFALLVVNDGSPDQSLTQKLRALAELSYFAYLENEVNLGFVGSVNRALTHSEGKDVILLNSDAIPFGDWIDRLMWHAHADADVATITPMSNNATVYSYPVNNDNNRIELEASAKTLDDYSKICNSRLSSPVPTGVGFCFYMRRSVIDCVGLLDAETFGRGYGEENDFCLRASQAGFRNILAHDVFVYHAGGVSFDNIYSENMAEIERNLLLKHPVFLSLVHQHLLADPGREARARLDLYRAAKHLVDTGLSLLLIIAAAEYRLILTTW